MSFKIKPANFEGKRGEQVPYVRITEGKCPGSKWGKDGNGLSPNLILAILDADHAHLRKVCNEAIALASPAPAKPTATAPKSTGVELFYVWDGENVLPPMSRADAMLHASNPLAQFSLSTDKNNWGDAARFGLVVVENEPVAPPAPPAPPVRKPEVASGPVASNNSDILAKIEAARGKRVLAAR